MTILTDSAIESSGKNDPHLTEVELLRKVQIGCAAAFARTGDRFHLMGVSDYFTEELLILQELEVAR